MKTLGIIILGLSVVSFIAVCAVAFASSVGWSLIELMGCMALGLVGTGLIEASIDKEEKHGDSNS